MLNLIFKITTNTSDPILQMGGYFSRPAVHDPRYLEYQQILAPTFEQFRYAVNLWDQIAALSSLKYAFVGRVVAILKGRHCQIDGMEILVEPSAMKNNAAMLTQIANKFAKYFAITPTNHHIIVIDGNKGVALEFLTTGIDGYPNFIPPYDSPLYMTPHLGLQPTFRFLSLGYPNDDRRVPLVLGRELLGQRLSRFNPTTTDRYQKGRNYTDIQDIKLFLAYTASDLDEPYAPSDVARFLPIVRKWILYAESFGVLTSREEVNEWRRLGLPLIEADISDGLRLTPVNPAPALFIPAIYAVPGQPAGQFWNPTQPGYTISPQQPSYYR